MSRDRLFAHAQHVDSDRTRYSWGGAAKFSGETLDMAAGVYGLTRAPGEGDALLRARMAIVDRRSPLSVDFAAPRAVHVTARITYPDDPNERSTMPPQNPYDRRSRPRDGSQPLGRVTRADEDIVEVALGTGVPRGPDAATGRSFDRPDEIDHAGLTLQDLEMLVRSKVTRARRDGDDAAYLRERERTREAARVAFEEGHSGGLDLQHDRIGTALGSRVHLIHDEAVGWLEKFAQEPRKVTRADLIDFVQRVGLEAENMIGTYNKLAPSPSAREV